MADGNSGRIEFLRNSLKQQIQYFGSRRRKNRRLAFWSKMAASSFGATTTILIGLESSKLFGDHSLTPAWLSAAALITSATVTLLSVWEGFFDYRWLWIRYTTTAGQLYSISTDLEYLASDNKAVTDDKLDALYGRLQKVLEETNSSWSEKRAKEISATQPAGAQT